MKHLSSLFKVGKKIKFPEFKQAFTIMAADERYLICVKPFNLKQTFQYTIVDLKKGMRGADNYHCKFSYDDPKECLEALNELNTGELELSFKRRCPLIIEKVY